MRLITIFLIGILLTITGCSKNSPTEPQPPQNNNTIISDKTIIVDEQKSLNVTNVSSNHITLSFTGAPPDISTGSILVSGKGNGFLRKVTATNIQGNIMSISTQNARLTEAIVKGAADTTISLTLGKDGNLNKSQVIQKLNGVTLVEGGISLSGVVLYSGNVGGSDLVVKITSGSISFDPSLDIGIQINNSQITEFHTIANGNVSFDANFTASMNGIINYSYDRKLISFSQKLIQFIGLVPVVEVVTLDFVGGFESTAGSNDSLNTGFDQNTSISVGAKYDNGTWSPVWEHNLTLNGHETTWHTSTNLHLKGYVKPVLSVKLYAVAGPNIDLKPYLGFDGTVEDVFTWYWELVGGIRSTLGFDVSVLGYNIANYSKDLLAYQDILASDSSSQVLSWKDDFESYTEGTFPSNWIADGNATNNTANYVDNTVSYNGDKSLRLFGIVGGCWGALAYRPITVDAPFKIELTVKNGDESLSGCHPFRAGIGLREGTSWVNPERAFIDFKNGSIVSGGGIVDLGTYSKLTWYTVKILYERPSPSEVKLSYWINDEFKGSEILPAISDENQLTNLNLTVNEGTAWFDDVKVFQ